VPLVPTLAFLALLAVMLFVDLAVLNRGSHTISATKALKQAGVWVIMAVLFTGVIYVMYDRHHFGLGLSGEPHVHAVDAGTPDATPQIAAGEPVAPPVKDSLMPSNGREASVMFATGYLLELMLSLDNMMVIAIIMGYFKVPAAYQHRALFWGIIGAVVLRGAMIGAGSALVHSFDWILYVFGAFLLLTAIKLFFEKEDANPDLEKNIAVRLARSLFPVSPDYVGSNFFTRINGRLAITPLMLALITIDFADAIFAVDSIPAAFSATKDPFLVLTSNCFAILGLRAIYFAVAAITERFRFLKQSMILILALIGVKMLLPLGDHVPWLHDSGIPLHMGPLASLLGIAGLMAGGVVLSIAIPAPPSPKDLDPLPAPTDEPHG
jgi:tellurite resistance protein TerC